MRYNNVQGGEENIPIENDCTLAWESGNINVDPYFANPGYWADPDDPNIAAEPNDPNAVWIDGDYHLKSQAGHWDPTSESWVFDDVTSPCIDAGDPNIPVAFEPFPNGGRINMGAYGGTAEASMSPSGIHAKYGGGTGEPNDPYLIYTAEQMNAIGTDPNDWDKHFKLMADIDLSSYTGTDFNIIGNWQDWDDYKPFTGIFDGNGHTISNFTHDCNESNEIGLFGSVGHPNRIRNPKIRDLGLIDPYVNAKTGRYVGSLVGHLRHGNITGCYTEGGRVSGSGSVGGLVGRFGGGTITSCHSSVYVMGGGNIAGLVGYNYAGLIANCFSNGNVIGNYSYVGGLVGCNNFFGEIVNCYATGDVTGDESVGGLVGINRRRETRPGRIRNCYSVGRVTGTAYVGGLVGSNWGTVELSFWDMETSGQIISAGGIGKTTAEMQTARTFLDAGWDFIGETDNGTDDIWWILEGPDYPRLWWELNNEK